MRCWLSKGRIAFTVCLAVVLLLGTGIPLQAAPPKTGTLKIHLKESKYCVEFAVYRVADYMDGNYELTSEFVGMNTGVSKGDAVNLNAMSDAASAERYAQKLADWAEKQKLAPMAQAYTREGVWKIGEVPVGMYLTVQRSHEADNLKVAPFLLGVPYWRVETVDGEEVRTLEYNVESQPKGEEEPPVPEKPEEPEWPEEPQQPEEPQNPERPDKVKTGDGLQEWVRFYALLLMAASAAMYWLWQDRKRKGK